MLSLEQINIITKQISKENASEFVEVLIQMYANNDIERIGHLLSLIPDIAQEALKIKQKRIQEYSWATDLLLAERTHADIKRDNQTVIILLYVCKAHFPKGNCNGGSIADKEVFNEFIELLRKKKDFNYEDEKDWAWVCNTADCRDWMLEVIKQNIDPDFVEPDVVIRKLY